MYADRTEPRVSVSKLAEYLGATAGRRRRIVTDQKHPRDFVVARYREAIEPMVACLSADCDDQLIFQAMDALESKAVGNDFQEQDRDLSIEALAKFLEVLDDLELDELAVERGETNPEKLLVAGVRVSVRPEILLRASGRGGITRLGALKIYIGKTHRLGERGGEYAATVLRRYLEEHHSDEGEVDHRLCLVLDVFDRKLHHAPRAYVRRMRDIEAACRELLLHWEDV